MRLSKLELTGFKSFANPTAIGLPEKIMAVVGPNGCGKSNISDALRWVLGAQSAKLLRGRRMDDFIFSGSRSRKPLGMAQVSLTMENGSGGIEFPGLENCTEVTVSRRVYRNGEAEYLINKTPCRLKDITDLFLDIGVGANILSIIEQGQIEQVISAKPADRRYIIEEAAGIAKFKDRKETALRKLMRTEDNLLRVKDILAEVKRQLNSLRRQAKKAERYKRYKQEAGDLELAILYTDYQGLAKRLSRLAGELEIAREKHEAASTEFNSAEARLETLRLTSTQARSEISRLSQEIHRLEKEALRTEADIQSSISAAGAMLTEAERLLAEIAELDEKRSHLNGEIEAGRNEERRLAEEAAERAASFMKLKTGLAELVGEYDSVREKLEEERFAYIDLLSALSRERNILNAGETQQQSLARREAKIREGKESASALIEGFQNRKEKKEAHLDELRSGVKAAEERREILLSESDELKNSLSEAQDEVSALKDRYSRLSARISSQEELLSSHEGYRDGVKTILAGRDNGAGLEGVRGVIADLLETSPRYETAIEAALGERLQYLVTEDHSHCFKALEYLKTSLGGRSTLIPVNPRAEADEAAALSDRPGVVGPARGLISCPQEYGRVFDYLLRNVLVVENLQAALNLWKANSIKAAMVTLEGEVIDPGGAVTGGAAADSSGSFLHRKRLLREMKQELHELGLRLERTIARRDEYQERYESIREELEHIDKRIKEGQVACLNCSGELDLIGSELQSASVKLKAVDYEEQELLREKDNYLREQQRARTELERLSETKEGLEKSSGELREKVEEYQSMVEEMKGKVIREEMGSASQKEKHTRCLYEIQDLLNAEEEIGLKLEQRRKRQEEAVRKREEKENKARLLKAELASLEREKSELSMALSVKKEEYEEAESSLSDMEAGIKSLRGKADESREHQHALSLREAELRVQMNNLVETARNRHGADLRCERKELPGEMEECKERLAHLNGILEKMGDVNMSALSEYEEVSERHDFLAAQHDDLVQSVEDLRQAIEKINRTTRVRFREAYEKINTNFKDMFVRLFGGGEAELVLSDESNLLETGMDIVARPPGKRLQNMTLLSSGEKALTSLALLFAVFLSKPSPFCLLDEVDAPLDEPNVERLTEVLRELSDRTQFIIITHNKRTMSAADLLYGITMEEDGVSKVLSIRLDEAPAAV